MLQILMGQLENLHVFIINLSFHAATAKIEFNGNFWEKSIIDVLNSSTVAILQPKTRNGLPPEAKALRLCYKWFFNGTVKIRGVKTEIWNH